MEYLYDILLSEFGKRDISNRIVPSHISDNIKPSFEIRPYQIEAFQRYILLDSEEFSGKPKKPYHILYNMATGSGKTLVMAGLILHLYSKGYRNFLFFVNSTNIIQKTKDNFLNLQSSKYLFDNRIMIDGNEVLIKEVESFSESDDRNINIKFTTIQKLHGDLDKTKENSLTYEDFQSIRIVLIADEAHHLNSASKKGQLSTQGTWENTVDTIFNQNIENILLEFTATLDYETKEIVSKYKNKVIFKYDLAQFRNDRYSKEINLIRSMYGEKERIIQALILNIYRQELATSHNINLKPVLLFKAKKTIAESERNKENFHKLIEELSSNIIENIRQTSTVPIVQKAFNYFDNYDINYSDIVRKIKSCFKVENCISANSDSEAERNQILLNSLEDENNPIRAVFAVQKLNEGWDVLNLFDIVRLYDDRDGKDGVPGKTTLSEAQLIGRGARYYPFVISDNAEKYKRKFDNDISNDLKVLEELYYHTKEDSRYISELKRALIDTGIYEDENNYDTKKLVLKEDFKDSDFYKHGHVFYNVRVPKKYDKIRSFNDIGVSRVNYKYTLSSGIGRVSNAFFDMEQPMSNEEFVSEKDVKLSDVQSNIIRYAISKNPFFHFNRITKYFPNLISISEFINSKDYLGKLQITFRGTKEALTNISHKDMLLAIIGLLSEIETDIKSHSTEYECSDYLKKRIHQVFKDKEIKVPKDSERSDGQEGLIANESWYAYNANYGTDEEKNFVSLFSRRFSSLNHRYDNIYLIRNERTVKIFDKNGRAFEPDFILFCKEKDKEQATYQVFIEPKGQFLIGNDKWKEHFLIEIRDEQKTIQIETDTYIITAVPFYSHFNENEFRDALEQMLKLT